jgi:hypothetical protein
MGTGRCMMEEVRCKSNYGSRFMVHGEGLIFNGI